MKKIGLIMIILGSIWGLLAFSIDTTVEVEGLSSMSERVHNIGLMDSRRNHLVIAGIIFVSGIILLGFGSVSSSAQKSKSVKQYISDVGEQKKCPACAETIKLEANKCRHCGEIFNPEEVKKEIAVFRQEQLQRIEKEKTIAAEREKIRKKEEEEFQKKLAVSYICNDCSFMVQKDELEGDLFCPECGGLQQAG